MRFDENELERIIDAQLVILGVAPGELHNMSLELKHDVLAIKQAMEDLALKK